MPRCSIGHQAATQGPTILIPAAPGRMLPITSCSADGPSRTLRTSSRSTPATRNDAGGRGAAGCTGALALAVTGRFAGDGAGVGGDLGSAEAFGASAGSG